MITYTEKISCKYDGQVNYLGVSVSDFSGSYYIETQTMGGIDVDVRVEKVMPRYIEFKVSSSGTPEQAVCTLTCHYQTTAGYEDTIVINMEFDNSQETYETALGNFTFLNYWLVAITGDAQQVPINYHTFNIDMSKSSIYTSSAWLQIEEDDPHIITLDAERYNSDGGGARTATINVEAFQPEYNDYFEPVYITVAQEGAGITPQNESYLNVQTPINVSYSAQTITVVPDMANITEFTVIAHDLWVTPAYNSSSHTISVIVAANTGAQRRGSFGIKAKGADGKEYSKAVFIIQGAVVVNGSIVAEEGYEAPYLGGNAEIYFTLTNVNVNTVSATTSDTWIRNLAIDRANSGVTFEVNANPNTAPRSGQIVLSGTATGGGTAYCTVTIPQVASPAYMEFPIWKDTFIFFETDTAIDYRLRLDGKILYQGRVFPISGVSTLYVNDILADFIRETLDFEETNIQDNNGYKMFVLQVYDDGLQDYTDVKVLRVWNNWTYDEVVQQPIISDMLSDVLDTRQYFVQSYLNTATEGTSPTIGLSGPRSTSTRPYNRQFTLTDGIQSVAFRAGTLNKLYVSINGSDPIQEYSIIDTCKPYALYWLNSKGGYNTYLFNKSSKQSDAIQNYEYSRTATDNVTNPLKEQYIKTITNRWSIKTDFISDSKSEIIAEIAHSPQVWLHILDEDRLVEVNVTDTQVDHKLFFNNSKKPVQYTFTVENKLTKLRK